MTEEQIHILQHSIGISDKAWEYRNRYCCDVSNPDVQHLVGLGLMEDLGPVNATSRPDYRFFRVTDEGKKVAWEHKPELKAYDIRCKGLDDVGPCIYHGENADKAKYTAYLAITDVFCDVQLADLSATRYPSMDRRDPVEVRRQ